MVTVTVPDRALGGQLAEQPVGASPRRGRTRPASRRRCSGLRPAGSAAPCRSRRRPARPARAAAGSGNGVPSGPTMSSASPARRCTSQRVPGPCVGDDELHGAGERPRSGSPRRSRTPGAAAWRVFSPPTATATKWPGRNPAAMPGATTVNCTYSPDPLHREDLGRLLHRSRGRSSAVTAARHAPRAAACRSCSERTPMSPRMSSSMPCTAAAKACIVVRHGMPAATAAVRIS